MKLTEEIKALVPLDNQEAEDIAATLDAISRHGEAVFGRDVAEHMCACAWVVNSAMSKVLFAHHNIFNSYCWLGGHADGEVDLEKCARREAGEESGVSALCLVGGGALMCIDCPVKEHVKKGKVIAPHRHLNLVYVYMADENAAVRPSQGENSAVAWLPMDKLADYVGADDRHMLAVYSRIIRKMRGNAKA